MPGRGFWIGLTLSIVLHLLVLASKGFQLPQWHDENPVIEARLEQVEPKPAFLPEPKHASTVPQAAVKPVAPPPATTASGAVPSQPVPVHPVDTSASSPEQAPAPTITPQAAPPLSTAPVPSMAERPYSTLEQASAHLQSLPARIDIVFELSGLLSGRQTHHWRHDGQHYSLETEGEVTGLVSLFVRGKLTQQSLGSIGQAGLQPDHYEMQRLSGKKETLDFDYPANQIVGNNGKRSYELPLMTGAQDPLSSIYQLAMAAQGGNAGVIVAATSKHVRGYPYQSLGMETLDTALGTIQALHVVRGGNTGEHGMDLWLSPQHHYLPVRVRYVDDDGREWTLNAVRIDTREN